MTLLDYNLIMLFMVMFKIFKKKVFFSFQIPEVKENKANEELYGNSNIFNT